MIFSPWVAVFLFFFIAVIGLLFAFLQIGFISYAFAKIGISPQHMLLLLTLTLLGSFINIPIKKIVQDYVVPDGVVNFFGIRYRVPSIRHHNTTVIAVNVGGALIPAVLSIYLTVKFGLYFPALLGVFVVSLLSYRLAVPIKGVGIGIPVFIPPVLAALCGLLLSPDHAPVVAYVSGSLGTLIGADILNLKHISRLEAPVASIGGAGTFDGVFLTGIMAVLLAT